MNEAQFKLEARLTAIEYLLNDLWAKWYFVNNGTNERVAAAHQNCIERLRTETFPGVPPEYSDAFSAELEDAVNALQSAQRTMLAGMNLKVGRT